MLIDLNRVPAPTLFPILTSLTTPATPLWFRVHLSTFLSLLPLRQNGVQHTINFIASTAFQMQHDPGEQRAGPKDDMSSVTLSVEILNQASKLLVAVPSSLTADAYFSSLGPQLLHLLDSKDIEMKRAAAYIVGNGILGRRKHGSPGTIGWEVFAQPILEAINPVLANIRLSTKLESIGNDGLKKTIVSETILKRALDRLSSLVLLHPNPGLTKRIITPPLLAMWGLWCFSKETSRLSWAEQIYELFCVYFKTAAGVDQFIGLIDHLRWSGGDLWTYGPGPEGGVELRERLEPFDQGTNLVAMVWSIDNRIDELMRLLRARVLDNDSINAVFLHASKHWLLGDQRSPKRSDLECGEHDGGDPLMLVVYAKITQKILEEYKDTLAANPNKITEFVNQLLAAFVARHRGTQLKSSEASKPSIAGLSSIFEPETRPNRGEDDRSLTTEEDPIEIISIALNLISAILSSGVSPTANTVDLIDFRINLSYLATSRTLPTSLILAASNIVALLDLQKLSPSVTHDKAPTPLDHYESDRESHSLALSYLVDDLPPVRAQGLSLLTNLLKKSSPVLDISSTTILLISLLQDEDEFIHLSAIQALSLLASKHPRTVIRTLVENYVDTSEHSNLDLRLRVGEALLKTVESLGENSVGQPAKLVSEAMVTVAGRRGRRVKQLEARAAKSQQEEEARKRAEEAWGGEVPKIVDEVEDEISQRLEKVVEGWEGSQGEEDVRIRTSALSILGVAIETNVAGVGPSTVSTAVDLVLAILKLEITTEKAILRRAAVLVIMSLVKALDAADEGGHILGFGFAGENLVEVISVLRYIGATDSDDLVRRHVGLVIDGLETWQSKTIFGVPRSPMDLTQRTDLNGEKLAGLSVNPEVSQASRSRIEEVE